MKKIYFPNLNGLRFIAALLVIIHHVEQFRNLLGQESYWDTSYAVRMIGPLGVCLFFVLSGFLITYLLLEEQQSTGTISIKDFYIRRILRIWGLYYLIIVLSLFILPNIAFFNVPGLTELVRENFFIKATLFVLFLPNLAHGLFQMVPYGAQTWSIGVEEQFYLIQPLIVKKFKNLPVILFVIIFVYFTIKWSFLKADVLYPNPYLMVISGFWQSLNFDVLAIGGLAAVILFKKHKILKLIFNRFVQVFILLLTIFLIWNGVFMRAVHFEFYATLFAIIILNLAANPKNILNLENPVLNYLGKISYGLYMYHVLVIVTIIKVFLMLEVSSPILMYILSLALTIPISAISYHFFENKLIKQKSRFSKILSGDSLSEKAESSKL